MRSFQHFQAKTPEEAVALLGNYRGKAKINAGGTDLLGMLKDEVLPGYPQALIDIKTIEGLDSIREEDGCLKIGALTRLRDIAGSPLLQDRYRVLADSARSVASPQIRNAATLGGNLCQEVRCWYFRYPDHLGGAITCARKGKGPCLAVKGDNRYHAVLGGKKCFAVCPSDTAVSLAALDASLVIVGPRGRSEMAVTDLYLPLNIGLVWNEMVTEIVIPKPPPEARQHWFKFTLRRPIDFAVASLAAVISEENGICREARLALGALAPFPFRAETAETFLVNRVLNEDTAAQAADLALVGVRPLSRNGYKVVIAKTLIRRAILDREPEPPRQDK
jgi:xanthine dehydrogenase YagS FAD-binding subunit